MKGPLTLGGRGFIKDWPVYLRTIETPTALANHTETLDIPIISQTPSIVRPFVNRRTPAVETFGRITVTTAADGQPPIGLPTTAIPAPSILENTGGANAATRRAIITQATTRASMFLLLFQDGTLALEV